MTDILHPDDERAPNERPVASVAPERLDVQTGAGNGVVPLYATHDWHRPQPGIRRAVIVIHGRLRNADTYFELARKARSAAGHDDQDTLLIVPQFLATADVAAHALPPDTLHWDWTGWMGGDQAAGPAPLSSFDVLDAILARLAQRDVFPSLETVVIAGHSGGGQVAQRYAVVTRGEARLTANGVAVRYVIANPSSYVYFDALRPSADGGFAQFDDASCPGFNDWKYGMNRLPAYALAGVSDVSDVSDVEDVQDVPPAAALEAAYVRRDVTVLLGGNDCDPAHPALDTSCAARAQGAHRLERGRHYARYISMRHPAALNHRTFVVDGFGHDGTGIFTSPRGIEALFDDARDTTHRSMSEGS